MSDFTTKLTAEFLKSIAHPVRVKILFLLKNGERCVCELLEETKIEQSNLSQHLSIMKRQGILDSRKEGTMVIYQVVDPLIYNLIDTAESIIVGKLKRTQDIVKLFK